MARHATLTLLFTIGALGGTAGSAGAQAFVPESIWTLCLATVPPVRPGAAWSAWSLAPEIAVPLAGFALLYGWGWWRARAGAVRGTPIGRAQGAATACGVLLLFIALLSPLCRLAASLAWSHMVQHLILVALAPPLILLGAPGRALSAAMGTFERTFSGRARANSSPRSLAPLFSAALAYGIAIWFWHIPAFYQAALTSEAVHLALVASLLAVSFWFWRALIDLPAQAFGGAVLVLFATMVHTGVLGALLTFAPSPLYALMAPGALAWGLLPLEDQQLAGLIMWVPMSGIYLLAALVIVANQFGGVAGHPARSTVPVSAE